MRLKFALGMLASVIISLVLSACGILDPLFANFNNEACPISPQLPDHPVSQQMRAPVGDYPVWFVTIGSTDMESLFPSLPPYNGGTVRKSIMVVSTELSGDLVVTGHQRDGNAVVLFPIRIDEETTRDGKEFIIYSDDDLSDHMTIPNAQITTNGTSAPGYASHPWGAYYPEPGCYELSGTYGGLTTTITVEIKE